ncbi:MAG: nucleotide exchange factor GrpE [Candidatus Limnocylindrales bacterium]
MNRKTRAEERIDALDTSPAALAALAAAQVDAVRAERDEAVAKAEAERDEFLAALQRERAEFTNFRRRTADERVQERGLAGVDLITKVLILADDFDRALETRPADLADHAWVEGIAAIDRKLRLLLESEGVSAVEATPGTPFDPREHEAVVSVPGTGRAEGVIVEEVRRGYRLRDRLIRPALVAVAAAPDPDAGPGPGLVN